MHFVPNFESDILVPTYIDLFCLWMFALRHLYFQFFQISLYWSNDQKITNLTSADETAFTVFAETLLVSQDSQEWSGLCSLTSNDADLVNFPLLSLHCQLCVAFWKNNKFVLF